MLHIVIAASESLRTINGTIAVAPKNELVLAGALYEILHLPRE
jgi:hypothetical protein